MDYQTKRVEINEFNVKYFVTRYGANGSIQPFTNMILEKFFEGRLVEIDDKNFNLMTELAQKLNTTVDKTVNLALESIDWAVNETPKPRITLDTGGKKLGKKIKNNINKITNF